MKLDSNDRSLKEQTGVKEEQDSTQTQILEKKEEVKETINGAKQEEITGKLVLQIKRLNPFTSIGVRLFFIFFISTMFFVLTLGITSYQMSKSTIEETALKSNEQTITQTSEKLDIIFKRYEESVLQVFMGQDMQDLLKEVSLSKLSDYDKVNVVNKMGAQLGTLILTQGVHAVYLFPLNDQLSVISAGDRDVTLFDNFREEAWFPDLEKETKSLWVPSKSANSGATMFRWVKSLTGLNSKDRYILVIDIDTKILTQELEKLDLGKGSIISIVSNDGEVIATNQAEEPGQEQEQATKAMTPYEFLRANGTPSESLRTKDVNGKSILAMYNTIGNPGWKLGAIVPVGNLVEAANKILVSTFVSALIVALIAVLLGIVMARIFANPLSKLNNLMLEGAEGNLKVRSSHRSRDEIGQLAVSFNIMMENITKLVQQTNGSALEVLHTAEDLTVASKKTALSAREIAIATEEIANGAGSLATEAERGNTLTENITRQMSAMIQLNNHMGNAARQVETSSQLGTEHLNELLHKTNMTVEMTRSLTAKVDTLNSSTSSVMKVLDVMQSITQQTNILSLNASIEAARAGAAGRGFMVVADEIRQLADQSRRSITMVGEITDKIQKEMNDTVQVLSDANPMFQEQIDSVIETSGIFVSVQKQMESFTAQLDSVTSSIGNLDRSQSVMSNAMSNVSSVAEESSATSEEVASLSHEQQTIAGQLVNLSLKLENVSTQLKDSLSRFSL